MNASLPRPPFRPLDKDMVVGGQYKLVHRLGRGGMAEVWVARRLDGAKHNKFVAIKVTSDALAGDERYRRMFKAEADLASLMTHANIVQVFAEGDVDGRSFMVMEWIDGCNLIRLRDAFAREKDATLRQRLGAYVAGQILHALSYAHALCGEDGTPLGIVHRDITPHNVIVSNQGDVKLLDFGIAHVSYEESSGTHIKGKLRYMAPEHALGKSREPGVDLYAAGAIMYELFTGKKFRGDTDDDHEIYTQALSGTLPPLTEPLPAELRTVMLGLLEPKVKRRVPSADVALQMLSAWPGYGELKQQLGRYVCSLTGGGLPRTGYRQVPAAPSPIARARDLVESQALPAPDPEKHAGPLDPTSTASRRLPGPSPESQPTAPPSVIDDDAPARRHHPATVAMHTVRPRIGARRPSPPPPLVSPVAAAQPSELATRPPGFASQGELAAPSSVVPERPHDVTAALPTASGFVSGISPTMLLQDDVPQPMMHGRTLKAQAAPPARRSAPTVLLPPLPVDGSARSYPASAPTIPESQHFSPLQRPPPSEGHSSPEASYGPASPFVAQEHAGAPHAAMQHGFQAPAGVAPSPVRADASSWTPPTLDPSRTTIDRPRTARWPWFAGLGMALLGAATTVALLGPMRTTAHGSTPVVPTEVSEPRAQEGGAEAPEPGATPSSRPLDEDFIRDARADLERAPAEGSSVASAAEAATRASAETFPGADAPTSAGAAAFPDAEAPTPAGTAASPGADAPTSAGAAAVPDAGAPTSAGNVPDDRATAKPRARRESKSPRPPVPAGEGTLHVRLRGVERAELRLGSRNYTVDPFVDELVPLGHYRARWRAQGETRWRNAGTLTFDEPRRAYIIFISPMGLNLVKR